MAEQRPMKMVPALDKPANMMVKISTGDIGKIITGHVYASKDSLELLTVPRYHEVG